MFVRKGLNLKQRNDHYYNYDNFYRYGDPEFLSNTIIYCVNGKYYIRDKTTKKILKIFNGIEEYNKWEEEILGWM